MEVQDILAYELFVSYRRRDDHDGSVEALVASICKEHVRFTPTPLRIFFDRTAIVTMQDWEHRILSALRSSKILLVILSRGYFESPFCRREWDVFAEHELDRHTTAEGIAPVYVETSDLFEDEKAARDNWISNLRRRQFIDLRPWWPAGPGGLANEEVRKRLEQLDQVLSDRLERMAARAASPTTTPPHNRNFVGRVEELRSIRESLALGSVGRVTAVQGIAGVGKSALAFEYAHAYAEEYSGGRFMLPVEGLDDLQLAMLRLANPLGIVLSDEEKNDPESAFLRIRSALVKGPRRLLLLDNVDRAGLLSPHQITRTLPVTDLVHVLATTRLDPQLFLDVAVVALEPLSEEDSVGLIEKYRPCGDSRERDAAREIARRLSGHPLALEMVGVFLWQNPEVGLTEYSVRLEDEGIQAIEEIGRDQRVQLGRHAQKSLVRLLEPTLKGLAPAEFLALRYAALLPADFVATPWLRALVALQYGAVSEGEAAKAGYPDPWRQVERRLYGMRLLVSGPVPELSRMHRLVQDVVWPQFCRRSRTREKLRERLIALARQRSGAPEIQSLQRERLWEIDMLAAFARERLEASDVTSGVELANSIANPLSGLFRLAEARLLLRHAIHLQDAMPDPAPSALAVSCSVLGMVESFLGNFPAAHELLKRSIHLHEQSSERNELDLASALARLATLHSVNRDMKGAQQLFERAVALQAKNLGTDHPRLAITEADLASVEYALGNSGTSRALMARAIECAEKALDAKDPVLARLYSDSSRIESGLGNLARAKALSERSLAIREAALGVNHPGVAASCRDIAQIEAEMGNLEEAKVLVQRAIEIFSNAFGAAHMWLADCYYLLGYVQKNLGNHEGLRELLEKTVDIVVRVAGGEHPSLATYYSDLGVFEGKAGNRARARMLLEKAIAIGEKSFGPDDSDQATTYAFLGLLDWEDRNFAKAIESIRNAHRIWLLRLGPDHKFTRSSAEWLKDLEGSN